MWILWDRKCEYGIFQITRLRLVIWKTPYSHFLLTVFSQCWTEEMSYWKPVDTKENTSFYRYLRARNCLTLLSSRERGEPSKIQIQIFLPFKVNKQVLRISIYQYGIWWRCKNQKQILIFSIFFSDPTLLPPKKTEIDLDTRNFALPPIYRVATLSNECKNAVDEYEEDSNVIKTVSQTLQNCILESQCKFLKISLFLTHCSAGLIGTQISVTLFRGWFVDFLSSLPCLQEHVGLLGTTFCNIF